MTDPTVPMPTQAEASAIIKTAYEAELAVVKARLAVLESDAKTSWSDVKAWFKANWVHLVTWLGVGALVMKVFGLSIHL